MRAKVRPLLRASECGGSGGGKKGYGVTTPTIIDGSDLLLTTDLNSQSVTTSSPNQHEFDQIITKVETKLIFDLVSKDLYVCLLRPYYLCFVQRAACDPP